MRVAYTDSLKIGLTDFAEDLAIGRLLEAVQIPGATHKRNVVASLAVKLADRKIKSRQSSSPIPHTSLAVRLPDSQVVESASDLARREPIPDTCFNKVAAIERNSFSGLGGKVTYTVSGAATISFKTLTWDHVRNAGSFRDAVERFNNFHTEHIAP
ncbi:rna-binding protein [Stemphylium lycopersici]|nr:rna-binding protein [Stemphylium lycopersici]